MSDALQKAQEAWFSYRSDVQPNSRHEDREAVAFRAGWDAAIREAANLIESYEVVRDE